MKTPKRFTKNNCLRSTNPPVQTNGANSEEHSRRESSHSYGNSGSATRQENASSRPPNDIERSKRTPNEALVAPRTNGEKIMAQIWLDVLGLQELSVNDNFFDYGRDSFRAMEIINRVRKIFAVSLSVQQLFENPTVAGMTAAVLNCRHSQQDTSASHGSALRYGRRSAQIKIQIT